MKSTIIAFAGKIGSGKSTLSNAVAERLGWPRVGFGDYVRKEARRRGLDESREVLQEIGASLVEDCDNFCLSVLAQVTWKQGKNLVVDGIRHTEVLQSLRKLTKPSEVFFIFMNVDVHTRIKRLSQEDEIDREKIMNIESHSTEAEVKTILPDIADLIVDGTLPLGDLVQEIVRWIQDKCEVNPNL